jgi:hypothetical protein
MSRPLLDVGVGVAALAAVALDPTERAIYDYVAWVSAGRPAKPAVAFDGYSPGFGALAHAELTSPKVTRLFVASDCSPD